MAALPQPFSQRDLDFIVAHFNRQIQRGERNLRSVIRQIGGIFPPLRAQQVIEELLKRNVRQRQGGRRRKK